MTPATCLPPAAPEKPGAYDDRGHARDIELSNREFQDAGVGDRRGFAPREHARAAAHRFDARAVREFRIEHDLGGARVDEKEAGLSVDARFHQRKRVGLDKRHTCALRDRAHAIRFGVRKHVEGERALGPPGSLEPARGCREIAAPACRFREKQVGFGVLRISSDDETEDTVGIVQAVFIKRNRAQLAVREAITRARRPDGFVELLRLCEMAGEELRVRVSRIPRHIGKCRAAHDAECEDCPEKPCHYSIPSSAPEF